MRKKWPEQSALRQREKFLLSPLTINGEVRWMERAVWVELCVYYGPPGTAMVSHYKWIAVAWGIVEEYVAKRDEWLKSTYRCG